MILLFLLALVESLSHGPVLLGHEQNGVGDAVEVTGRPAIDRRSRVDGELGQSDRLGGQSGQLPSEAADLFIEQVDRVDGVHKSHGQGVLGVDVLPGHGEPFRPVLRSGRSPY